MFQRLSLALARLRAGNTPEKLLNQIIETPYSFYREKAYKKAYNITEKAYNNIMNSIKL